MLKREYLHDGEYVIAPDTYEEWLLIELLARLRILRNVKGVRGYYLPNAVKEIEKHHARYKRFKVYRSSHIFS